MSSGSFSYAGVVPSTSARACTAAQLGSGTQSTTASGRSTPYLRGPRSRKDSWPRSRSPRFLRMAMQSMVEKIRLCRPNRARAVNPNRVSVMEAIRFLERCSTSESLVAFIRALLNTTSKASRENWYMWSTLASWSIWKNSRDPRSATGLYTRRLLAMFTVVALASAMLWLMDLAVFLVVSRFSMSTTFSRMSPVALESSYSSPSSHFCRSIFIWFMSRSSPTRCSSRSGRSRFTTVASSWSSSPSSVTMKLISVVCAAISGL
mmetsp:Transcript_120631/g.210027  ORF Transcript_120631/g.210027 Transcript_120631/m.210027 type:complete len:263 (+) Transcript_120631:716-1504(+)